MINMIADNATLIGLVFFFGFFVAVVIRMLRPGAKNEYGPYGQIPLKEDEND